MVTPPIRQRFFAIRTCVTLFTQKGRSRKGRTSVSGEGGTSGGNTRCEFRIRAYPPADGRLIPQSVELYSNRSTTNVIHFPSVVLERRTSTVPPYPVPSAPGPSPVHEVPVHSLRHTADVCCQELHGRHHSGRIRAVHDRRLRGWPNRPERGRDRCVDQQAVCMPPPG